MSSVIMSPISGRPRTMTTWAGWLLAAISTAHMVIFLVVNAPPFYSDWLQGGLWGDAVLQVGRMPESPGMFWASIGSFAVPLFLVGMVIAQLARAGYAAPIWVHWTLGGWMLIGAFIYEPGGFPVGLVLVGILLAAERMRRQADRDRTTASA